MDEKIIREGINVTQCSHLYKTVVDKELRCSREHWGNNLCNPVDMGCPLYIQSLKDDIETLKIENKYLKQHIKGGR